MSTNQQLYSLMIVNRAGGLIYSKLCVAHTLNTNDLLRIASTFHGINAIAKYSITTTNKPSGCTIGLQQLPIVTHGIHTIEYNSKYRIQSMETLTGMKFICTSNISMPIATCERYLHSLYELYSDYVLKNCFYDIDNPIRVDKFDSCVQQLCMT